MRNRNQYVFLLLVFMGIISGVLFFPSFFVYFVQDDFLLLNISRANTIKEFFHFFIPLNEVPWYRPLSSQVFFWFGQLFFGLNPLPWHVMVFLTHLGTAALLFTLIKQITNKFSLAALSAFLYATHGLHLIALSWLAAYSFVLGPFIGVAALLLYSKKHHWWSVLLFSVGLLTAEVHILLPIVLLVYQQAKKEKDLLIRLIPFVVLSGTVLLMRFMLFPAVNTTGLYQIGLMGIVSTTKFYLMQAIGFPMLFTSMPSYLFIPILIAGLFLIIVLTSGLLVILKQVHKQPWWIYVFASIGIIYTIPFLLLPNHIAPHYLSFAFVGIAVVFAYCIEQATKQFKTAYIPFIILSVFLVLQYINVSWTHQTHWLFTRANLAKILVEKKDLVHPVGSEEFFSLGANEASVVFK